MDAISLFLSWFSFVIILLGVVSMYLQTERKKIRKKNRREEVGHNGRGEFRYIHLWGKRERERDECARSMSSSVPNPQRASVFTPITLLLLQNSYHGDAAEKRNKETTLSGKVKVEQGFLYVPENELLSSRWSPVALFETHPLGLKLSMREFIFFKQTFRLF